MEKSTQKELFDLINNLSISKEQKDSLMILIARIIGEAYIDAELKSKEE